MPVNILNRSGVVLLNHIMLIRLRRGPIKMCRVA